MAEKALVLGADDLVGNRPSVVSNSTVAARLQRLTRESTLVTEALARTPLRFSLIKPVSKRIYVC
jgi:hypothetical protein